ncbi:hypothetical protein BSKO_00156 [Bryopsis sp. KO-2023]|nr:hypothetical protein BSKO_00156 [Bryopsis sp. KO-2023]
MEEFRKLAGQYEGGKEVLDALDKEEKSAPGVSDRISTPLLALLRTVAAGAANGSGVVKSNEEIDALSTIKDISSVVPRGKADLIFTKNALVLKGKANTVVPYDAIMDIAVIEGVPHKAEKVYMVLSMTKEATVMTGKQKLPAVLISMDRSAKISIPDPSDTKLIISGNTSIVLFQSLTKMGVSISSMVGPGKFQSSAGHKAVSAVMRVSQGWMFPLDSAVCFVERPPMIIKHSDIKAIEPNRAGGGSSTFDLFIHTSDGNMIQFQQIGCGELPSLMAYCEERKIKVGPPEEERSGRKESGASESRLDDEDDDEDDDSDFNPDDSNSDEDADVGASGAKRKRGASGEGYDSDVDEEDDDDSDVELVSEDDIPVAALAKWMHEEELTTRPKKSTKRDQGFGGGGSGGGGGSSGAG